MPAPIESLSRHMKLEKSGISGTNRLSTNLLINNILRRRTGHELDLTSQSSKSNSWEERWKLAKKTAQLGYQ
jgi:hypothetical protein